MVIEDEPEALLATDDNYDELPHRVLEFVQASPGELSEAIARALGTTTAMIAPALRMLVQGGRLRKEGVGRGTHYFTR